MLKALRFWRKYFSITLIVLLLVQNFLPMVHAEEKQQVDNEGISLNTNDNHTYVRDSTQTQLNPKKQQVASAQSTLTGRLLKGSELLANTTFSIHTNGNQVTWYDFTTDVNGVFQYQLPDGEYMLKGVWVEPKWYELNKTITIKNGLVNGTDEFVVNILENQSPDPEPVQLNILGTLTKGSSVLANIPFSLHSHDGAKWYDVVTDSTGKFGFSLPDGNYQIDGIWLETEGKWYVLNQTFSVVDGALQGATDLHINVAPVSTNENVKGILTKGNELLQNVVFSIHHIDGTKWYDTTTNEAGQFGFQLPDGSYQIDGVWLPVENEWYVLNQTFTVKDGILAEATTLDINLEPVTEFNVTGQLKKGDHSLQNVVFSVFSTTGEEIWYDTKTDENGQFGFKLPDGSYKLAGIWVDSESRWYELQKDFDVNGAFKLNIDLELTDVPNFNVTGQLKKGTVAIADTWLSVHNTNNEEKWYDAKTDADGHFGFTLPNGTYQLDGIWVEAEGKWYPLNQIFTVEGTYLLDINLISQGEDVPNVVGKVQKGEQVIADTWFSIHTINGEEKWYDVQTDKQGDFSVELPDGDYQLDGIWLESERKWYVLNLQFAISGGKLVGSEPLMIDLIAQPPANTKVLGFVRDSNAPLGGVKIAFSQPGTNNEYFATADANGQFIIDLPNGEFLVYYVSNQDFNALVEKSFTIQDGKVFASDQEVTSLEVSLPAITVNGKLFNNGEAVANAHVVVKKGSSDHFVAFTNEKGEFRLRLADGSYSLGNIFYDGSKSDASSISFEVVNGSTSPIAIDLDDLVNPIKGNFVGVLRDSNVPIANAEVFLTMPGDKWFTSITTNNEGRFASELPDGEYVIEHVKPEDSGQLWLGQSFLIEDGQIVVSGSRVNELVLTIPHVTLTGYVSDGQNTIAHAVIKLSSDDNPTEFKMVANELGQYSYRLPDGDYRVDVVQADGLYYHMNLAFSIMNGQVQIDGETKEQMDITLPTLNFKAQVVNGIKGVENAFVLYEKDGSKQFFHTKTDENGFIVGRLSDGTYKISHIGSEIESFDINTTFEIVNGKLFSQGQEVEVLTITIQGGYVYGQVFNPDGTPASHVSVRVSNLDNTSSLGVNTSENGKFSILLTDGNYQFSQFDSQLVKIPFSIKNGRIFEEEQAKESFSFTLAPITVSGMIKDKSGNIITDAEISISGNNTNLYIDTDANGEFHLRFSDGVYIINNLSIYSEREYINVNTSFELKNGVLKVEGIEKTFLDITVPSISVQGKVYGPNGKPLAGYSSISIQTDSTEDRRYYYPQAVHGNFDLRLPDGHYVVKNIRYGRTQAFIDFKFSVINGMVEVNGQVKDQLEVIYPELNLTGQILDEHGKNLPYSQVQIEALSGDKEIFADGQADENGIFQVGLPDGQYRVRGVTLQEHVSLDQEFEIIGGNLHVNGQISDQLVIQLLPVSVKGLLLSPDGTPLYGSIQVQSKTTNKWYYTGADSNGNFQYRLPDGEYILTSVYDYRQGDSYHLNINFAVVGGRLTVNGVNQDLLTVTLPKIYQIQGNLTESVEPLANVFVVWGPKSGNSLRGEKTDASGHFSISVQDGEYFVDFIDMSDGNIVDVNMDFAVIDGKLFVHQVEQEKLLVTILKKNVMGQVIDGAGPISKAVIEIQKSGTGKSYAFTSTNQTGEYSFRLPDGDYIISRIYLGGQFFEKNIAIKIMNGILYVGTEKKERLDFTIPNVTAKGTLWDGNTAVADAEIVMTSQVNGMKNNFNLRTNSNGTFSARIPDGIYTIEQINQYSMGTILMNMTITIQNGKMIKDGMETSSLDIYLPAITVIGQIVDGIEPVGSNQILVKQHSTNQMLYFYTDNNGFFNMRLADGEYTITDLKHYFGFNDLSFKVEGGKLYVSDVLTDKLMISIPPNNFKGQLLDRGNPVGDAIINISKKGENSTFYLEQSTFYTKSDGSFQARLEDGEYLVNSAMKYPSYETIKLNTVITIKDGKVLLRGEEVDQVTLSAPSMVKLVKIMSSTTSVANREISIRELVSGDSFSAKTDSNGEINKVLPDGFYELISMTMEGSTYQSIRHTIEVFHGQTIPSPYVLDLNELPKANTIQGLLTYQGKPLANTLVEYKDNTTVTKSFMTNSTGAYSVQLADGYYQISGIYSNELGKISFSQYQSFYVVNGKALINWAFVDQLEIALPVPTGQGKIVENGVAIPKASLEIYKDGTNQQYWISSNQAGEFQLRLSDGNYTIKMVRTQEYSITVEKKFTIQNGLPSEDPIIVDVNVPYVKSGNVKGIVRDDQGIIRFAEVKIQRLDASGYEFAQTNANGEFQISLPDGSYKIYEVYQSLFGSMAMDQAFMVKNGEVFIYDEKKAMVELTIPKVTVKGQITDGRAPVGVYEVVFKDEQQSKYHFLLTDRNGQFNFRLPEGSYSFIRIADKVTNKITDVPMNVTVVNGVMHVNGEEKEKIDIKIPPISFKGQILDPDGKPVSEGWINVKYKPNNSSYYTYKTINTDQYGFFSDRLPDGDYNIYYAKTQTAGWPILNLPLNVKDGKMVLSNGEVSEFLAIKLPAVTVHGVLLNNGKPVPNNRIEINVPGQTETYDIYTDSEGKFTLRAADGEYLIPRITIGQGYVYMNKTIKVINGTTDPSPIVIDMADY